MKLWRICRSQFASAALSGEGARLFGGRWNSRGVSIVYGSTSLALAAVETFVHLELAQQPNDLVSIEINLPDKLARTKVAESGMPKNWRSQDNKRLRKIGDTWIVEGKTVALEVPSAVIAGEWNMLLNPVHVDFAKIQIGTQTDFIFDMRMFR